MKNSWIIDVLSDMTQFAEENALPETRKALKAAIAVARKEVVSNNQPKDYLMAPSVDGRATH